MCQVLSQLLNGVKVLRVGGVCSDEVGSSGAGEYGEGDVQDEHGGTGDEFGGG